MRIGCLQFAPQVGDVGNNMNRADAVLSRANPDIDLLVLPEMAFSGYNFSSLEQISPYLEATASGVTALWARTTALKYDCVVTVGYPEKVKRESWKHYNSAIVVNKNGETAVNYRKTFLYPCDETWALEGPDEFFDGTVPGLGYIAMGIGMDLNPYRFESPWNVWEFANYVLHRQPGLVILSMAWITHQDYGSYSRKPTSPDLGTLSYWVARFEPLIRAENQGEVIVVIANRSGSEVNSSRSGVECNTVYAGTSCVLGIEDGEVKVYGILGRGQKELLVVDTKNPPQFKLVAEQGTPIYEDKAQSREALHMDTELLAPKGSRNPDTPYPSDEIPPLGFEAAFGEIIAVSPVEPFSSHAFFSHSPSKRWPTIISSESAATPIASTLSSPISFLGQPTSPDSARGGSSPSESLPTSQDRLQKLLHIASVFDRQTEPRSALTPDSASSISVNTAWDRSPRVFTAEQFIKITPPSPMVEGVPYLIPTATTNLRHESQPVPPPEPQKPTGDRHASPQASKITDTNNLKVSQAPTLKTPQPRNLSRTQLVQRQPTIASQDFAVETARVGVVVPIGAVQVHAARNPAVDLHRIGMTVWRARSVSPPPTPATALWIGDKSSWRESHLW